MTQPLRLSVLGKVSVVYAQQDVTNAMTTKMQALLCYLAVTGQSHTRHALTGLLWGEVSEQKAKNSLRVALAKLRKMIGEHLIITRQSVAFDRESDYWLDVAQFERQTHSFTTGKKSFLQEAFCLYRGDFFSDFYVEGACQFEEWMSAQRAYWQPQALRVGEWLAKQCIAERAYSEAIVLLKRCLTIEPWQECSHRQLMLAYSRIGKYNAALEQYESCYKLLDEGLGVLPMPETQALYERIKIGRQARLHNLPPDSTPFVGREKELTQIHQMLSNPDCRLLTIVGIGGMGKTRLALAAARLANQEQAVQFLNGVFFVSLVGVDSVDALPLTIAHALNIPLSGLAHPTTDVLNYLRRKEMLLVLDNFEQLLDGVDWLNQLLRSSADIKLLVTSREALNLSAEWRFDLEGLACSSDDGLALESISGVKLFLQSARQVRSGFELTETNEAHICSLCELVAGMPLAIKLAATWLRVLSCERIVEELKRNIDILTTRMRDVPMRQRSMRAIFDYTWQLLTESEQSVFQAISCFRGGFTEEAVFYVAGATPFLLAGLLDRGLIQLQNEPLRYQIHELTQQYAAEKLNASPHASLVAERHSTFYLNFVAKQQISIYREAPELTIPALKDQIDNIRQAWRWAVTNYQVKTLTLAVDTLAYFYEVTGLVREAKQLFGHAIKQFQHAFHHKPSPDISQLLCQLLLKQAKFLELAGELKSIKRLIELAFQLAKQTQNRYCLAEAHCIWGRALQLMGELDQAIEEQKQAVAHYEALGEKRPLALALDLLGHVYFKKGMPDKALDYHQQALQINLESGDKYGQAFSISEIGNTYLIKERYQLALSYLKDALCIFKEFDSLLAIGRTANNIGLLLYFMEKYTEALSYLEHALQIEQELGNYPADANTLDNLGRVHMALGSYTQARDYYQQALSLFRDSSEKIGIAEVLNMLGILHTETGEYEQARQQLQEALILMKEIGNEKEVYKYIGDLGTLYHRMGDDDKAMRHYEKAIKGLKRVNGNYDGAQFMVLQAELFFEQGFWQESRAIVTEGIALAQSIPRKSTIVRGQALLERLNSRL